VATPLYQPFPMTGRARAQVWRYSPEYRRPRHFHVEPEFNLVVAGHGLFGAGETSIPVEAGDLLWWAPGQDHELMEASPDFDLFVVGVSPELSAQVLGSEGASFGAGATRLRLPGTTLARFHERCAVSPALEGPAAVERHVAELWREAHALHVGASEQHVLTRRALRSLQRWPELRRSDVAEVAGADPSDISRYFRRDVGVTLTTYRTRLRLLRFISVADAGSASLMAAADEAGFGSYSQCHRAFHQIFGCTPRTFFGGSVRERMRDAYAPWPAAASRH
jgi:AraC-like DNA-binding protein